MRYTVTSEFTRINESGGTIQNTSNIYTIEVSAYTSKDSGILVYPLNTITFRGSPVYMRCIDDNALADVRVVSFTIGGESATVADENTVVIDGVTYTVAGGADVNSGIDAAFNGDGSTSSGDPDFDSSLDNIFSGDGSTSSSGDPDFDSSLDDIFNP